MKIFVDDYIYKEYKKINWNIKNYSIDDNGFLRIKEDKYLGTFFKDPITQEKFNTERFEKAKKYFEELKRDLDNWKEQDFHIVLKEKSEKSTILVMQKRFQEENTIHKNSLTHDYYNKNSYSEWENKLEEDFKKQIIFACFNAETVE
jgi:hypothetical protein